MARGGNQQPGLDASEHIGPDSTGDNIEAKRVGLYVWNGASWQRMVQPGSPSTAPSSPTVTSVADTTTSTEIIASNIDRKEVEFFNTSTATLYLLKGSGTASATNFTVYLNQGDYYSTNNTSAFQGVWASDTGGSVLVTESE